MTRTIPTAAALVAAGILLAGCAASGPSAPSASPSAGSSVGFDDGHGHVDGAAEVVEPQSRLLTVSGDGSVTMTDLLSSDEVAVGSVGSPSSVASDGRFAFVTTDAGIDVVDGGAWTWDHGDHFHYYSAEPRVIGTIEAAGAAEIATPSLASAGTTGVFLPETGEAVAIDMASLAEGEIVERFRIDTGASSGVVAPVGEATIVATGDAAEALDASGSVVATAECADPAGSITTRVGTVVGCADKALLAVASGSDVEFADVPYPSDEPRAEGFAGRKNRPTVAGLSGENGFWLLDTRAGEWSRAAVDATLTEVVAADDEGENVVALDGDGRVRVFGEDGSDRGSTDPLTADAAATLVVDTQRAYLSAPDAGVVYEIDYADGARIAREIPLDHAVGIEVGR
ncbi:hypothetical protein [Microbacterium indicum]|uniref:hypothetical protein n=1 Tax=Microbacterium indicum TaxID=358100 RepID=UPI0003FEA604|nr:hypothetical protein [Microbacterium indicum]